MKKFRIKELLIGFLFGVVLTVIGSELYLRLFTNFDLFLNFDLIRKAGLMGKITAIGSLLNLVLLTYFLNRGDDFKARGSVIAVIVVSLITFFL